MKYVFLGLFVILKGFGALNAQATTTENSPKPLVIGEVITINSDILSEARQLNIHLPEEYNSVLSKKYPVIYVLDGGLAEDFMQVVSLVKFYNLHSNMPSSIIVGIVNTDKKSDFTFPTTDKKLKKDYPTTGNSRRFIDFLSDELFEVINKKYRTTNERTLIGQALGGLLATEILLKKPDLFTNYFIVSPSLWWDNETLLKEGKLFLNAQNKIVANVYLAVGNEGELMAREAQLVTDLLKNSKHPALSVHSITLPEEDQITILHQGLNALYKYKYPPSKN